MEVVELVGAMQSICAKLRRDGHHIRLVPTMGALHSGHGSLIMAANAVDTPDGCGDHLCNDVTRTIDSSSGVMGNQVRVDGQSSGTRESTERIVTIVSIFANRKQFNNVTDFDSYPNTLDADLDLCRRLNVRYVFVPNDYDMYPMARRQNDCMVTPPDSIGRDLEGKSRPGHFSGMLTCVCKLLNIVKPNEAFFGEKDYQQLVLVTRMVQDLNIDTKIRPVPTVRESDLLPLSSRNVRLNGLARKTAPVIYKILIEAKQALEIVGSKSESENNNVHDKSESVDLNNLLAASAITSLCLHLDKTAQSLAELDYLALRCARDFSEINYEQKLDAFECKEGCARCNFDTNKSITLECRLLIAIVVDGVRLLDNIQIKLNKTRSIDKRCR